MGKSQVDCAFVFLAWLVLFLSLTCCCSCSYDVAILDVSSSLQLTRHVFSPKSHQLINVVINNSHPLTLTLHPRHSLPNFLQSFNNNYTALTLSRLARDHQLHAHSRCSPHLNNSKHSRNQLCQEHLQAPLISGVRLGSGEYFARLGLGQPVNEFFFSLDTGSDLTWLQCQPCASCYRQSDPIFNPSASTTYKLVPCNSPRCTSREMFACGGSNCLYTLNYGDNSYTVGNLATEKLSFGNTGFLPNFVFGCGHVNQGLFSGSAGLLGAGGGSFSLPSQLNATSFSYCLVHRDSSSYSTLEFNSAMPADSVVAPMPRNTLIDTYFYVALTGIQLGGLPVRIPPSMFRIGRDGRGGVIVDSGTAVSRFQPEMYAILRDTFRSMTRELPAAEGFSLFDTCYNLSSMRTVRIPTLSFEFGNGERLSLRASNYLIPVSSDGRFCFGFAETTGATSIIGNVQQQGTRVTYDLVKKSIGFSQNKC